MQYRFFFKQMETSQSLERITQEKMDEHIIRFVTKPIEAHITFSVSAGKHHMHCSLTGGDGFKVEVDAASHDMYATVDLAVNKLNVQLKKRKEKLKEHKGHENVRQFSEHVQRVASRPANPDYVDAEDILKYEAAMKRRSNAR